MGIPNDITWYVLIPVGIALAAHDTYRAIPSKVSKANNYLSLQLEEAIGNMPTADDLLYHLNLSFIPRAFPQFTLLPAEIRCQIWVLALPGPRVIEVRNHTGGSATLHKDKDRYLIKSICQIPVHLHVCRESRGEALKHYSLAFGMGGIPPKIYVDFSRDIIYFGPKSDFFLAQGQRLPYRSGSPFRTLNDLRKIQFLALRSRTFGYANMMKLKKFECLKEVICVAEHYFQLGKEPCLKREEFSEVVRSQGSLSKHYVDLVVVFGKKKVQEPGWKVPTITKGRLLLGRGTP